MTAEEQEIECDVYRSQRKADYYLYVPADDGLDRVPEALLQQLGAVEKTLTFTLTRERQLAREDATQVMSNLEAKGYHLQLPPPEGRLL